MAETPRNTAALDRPTLIGRYRAVRASSEALAAPLSAEDQMVQSFPDASPTKWHLAHTSWFFEVTVLQPHGTDFRADPSYAYLFNSYYEALGPRQPRPARGLLSRPSVDEVMAYRQGVDRAIHRLIEESPDASLAAIGAALELGLQHEQQHQELILTDIKHALFSNPLLPAYDPAAAPATQDDLSRLEWRAFSGGVIEIGADGADFAFDNELPRHQVLLRPYRLASRLVTNGEYLAFIADGGYRRPEFWLSEGWSRVQQDGWDAPLYWLREPDGDWRQFGLSGVQALPPDEPVAHVSFFEAAAYASWAGKRLPTEAEWEHAALTAPGGLDQLYDAAWQWTRSSYDPYPGYRPFAGVAAEYNGKFMVGQLVLRGGSRATPAGHSRASYRNFFPPATRWQFSGIRLAEDR